MNKKIIFITPLIALIVSLILFFIALKNSWFGEPGQRGLIFCEHSRNAIIKQPANTFSNIGFMLVGLIIAWQMMNEKYTFSKNRLTTTLFYPTFFATLCVLMGPGSMAMHASTSIIGSYFDVLSMYLLAAFMFAYALIRLFNLSEPVFFVSFLMVIGICNLVYFYFGNLYFWLDRMSIFGIFIVFATLLEYLVIFKKQTIFIKKWMLLSTITFVIAAVIWHFSKTGNILCYEYSLIQGHAVWHILDALALYFLFRYYVSEKENCYGK